MKSAKLMRKEATEDNFKTLEKQTLEEIKIIEELIEQQKHEFKIKINIDKFPMSNLCKKYLEKNGYKLYYEKNNNLFIHINW